MRRRLGLRRTVLVSAGVTLLIAGGSLAARRAYLGAKAAVARQLIARALEAHLRDGGTHRPWSWADLHPIARLEAPRLRVARPILSGASGSTLAFGAGHVGGTAPPGRGNCVLAGHRDGAFAFLRHLEIGDLLRLRTAGGARAYIVSSIGVVGAGATGILAPGAADRLTLVTCWPFGGLARSPWRFVVVALPAPRRSTPAS